MNLLKLYGIIVYNKIQGGWVTQNVNINQYFFITNILCILNNKYVYFLYCVNLDCIVHQYI